MQVYSTVHGAVGFPVVSLVAACHPVANTVLILVSRFHGPCRCVAQIGISPKWVEPTHANRRVLHTMTFSRFCRARQEPGCTAETDALLITVHPFGRLAHFGGPIGAGAKDSSGGSPGERTKTQGHLHPS